MKLAISFPERPELNNNRKYEWKTLESTQLTILRKPQITETMRMTETERFDGKERNESEARMMI